MNTDKYNISDFVLAVTDYFLVKLHNLEDLRISGNVTEENYIRKKKLFIEVLSGTRSIYRDKVTRISNHT